MSASVRIAAQAATVFAGSIVGVVALADSAREHDGVPAHLDTRLATDAVDDRSGLLSHVARLLTLLGSEVVVGVLALLLIIVLLERRGPFHAMCVAVAVAASASLTVAVKLLVARDRPGAGIRLGPVDSSYSFPSGHTLNSTVFLGLVVILLVPTLNARRQRITVIGAAVSLAFGIGLSRVYLGYHWASDVAASWLLAIALLTLVDVSRRRWEHGRDARGVVRRQSGRSA
jgi:membrane-associated phospholipid phosphatase